MPDLNCSVTECGHNAHGLCSLQHVDVARGNLADTCCASFTALRDLSFLGANNSAAHNSLQEQTGVKCNAKDCYYNQSLCCSADRIKIVAACDPHNCGDTKCGTYKKQPTHGR